MSPKSVKNVAVVGLGYVGLPLCESLTEAGLHVTGIDRDLKKVAAISAGLSPISDLTSMKLQAILRAGFTAQSDFSAVEKAHTVVLSLPTPLNDAGDPDLTALLSGVDSIAPHLNNRILVLVESTVAPGTTDGIVLSRLKEFGKVLNEDFLLGYSPERVDPGTSRELQAIPKIVSGVNADSLERAKDFYEKSGFQVVEADNTRDAEAAKLLENTYRAVNIALINELAQASAHIGVNIGEAIRLASTKPFGFTAFYPGAGVGGHCIPIDPVYLKAAIESAGGESELVGKTLERNQRTPGNVANRIIAVVERQFGLNSTHRIILLGMTYKPEVNDFREAPGPEIANILQSQGFHVCYHDPFLSKKLDETIPSIVWLGDGLRFESEDIVVLLQSHTQYEELELGFLPRHQRLCAGVSTGQWTSIWDPSILFDSSQVSKSDAPELRGSNA